MAPWKLPILVIAIAVPTVTAFYLGGPGVGVAVGALVAVAIVFFAARAKPRGAIGEPPSASSRRRLLVVAGCPLEDPSVVARIVGEAGDAGSGPAEVRVLAPARLGFLDRWASDLEGARRRAQQNLVITVASLAKAGVAAEARVGDEDLVQAVEDALGSYAATEVILVSEGGQSDPAAVDAARELKARLRPPFLSLEVSGPATR